MAKDFSSHPPVLLYVHRNTHPLERIPATGFWIDDPDRQFSNVWQVQILWRDLPQDFRDALLRQHMVGKDTQYLVALIPDDQVTFEGPSNPLLAF